MPKPTNVNYRNPEVLMQMRESLLNLQEQAIQLGRKATVEENQTAQDYAYHVLVMVSMSGLTLDWVAGLSGIDPVDKVIEITQRIKSFADYHEAMKLLGAHTNRERVTVLKRPPDWEAAFGNGKASNDLNGID